MQPRAEDSELQTRTMRKLAVRLIPVLLGLYIIAYLDRVNVTFAQDKVRSSTRSAASATSARAS
jgi:hypothetical protein